MTALPRDINDALRAEKSWENVSSGLTKVLLGYAVFTLGYMVAAGLMYNAAIPMFKNRPLKIEHMWYFYIGAAVMKVTGLLSWTMILGGQWRCLMSSSERGGARWIMFMCMTCVVMGPALQFAAWLGGMANPIRWTAGPVGFTSVKFTMLGLYLFGASLITFVLYTVSFWYYLRTVTVCMGAEKAKWFVTLFFAVFAGAVGFTAYLIHGRYFGNLHTNRFNDLLPWAGVSWVAVWLYWVAQIVVTKSAIDGTMELVRNPMDLDVRSSRFELAGS